MIQEHLNNIRKKPKAVRSQYAMVAASVFTGVLALLWVTTLPGRFAVENVDPYVQQQMAAAAVAEEERPDVKALFASLRDGMAALIFKTEPEEEVVPEDTETKTIDIDALLRESAEAPTEMPEDAAMAATSSAGVATSTSSESTPQPTTATTTPTTPVGEVILIGTTSSQKNTPGNP
jgi:hypothetical protein